MINLGQSVGNLWKKVLDIWRRLEWQVKILFFLSLIITIYVQTFPFYYGLSDSQGYFRFARLLLGQPDGMMFPDRTPGASLLLILTGVLTFESWKGFIWCLGIMGLVMPLFIYYSVTLYASKNWGFLAGILSILSAVPYLHSKTLINPDHLVFFFGYLSILLIAIYFRFPSKKYLPYVIAIVLVAACLVRPVPALYFFIFLFCAIAFFRAKAAHAFFALGLYLALMSSWSLLDREWGQGPYPPYGLPNGRGERRLAEAYFANGGLQFVTDSPPPVALMKEKGPYSQELWDIVRGHIQQTRDTWMKDQEFTYPHLLFGKFAEDPDGLLHAVMSRPNSFYFMFLNDAVRAKKADKKNEFMLGVGAEQGTAGFKGVIRYFAQNPKRLILGGESSSFFGARNLLSVFRQVIWRSTIPRNYSLEPPTVNSLVRVENGPFSQEFFNSVRELVKTMRWYWYQNPLYEKIKDNPDAVAEDILNPKVGIIDEWREGIAGQLLVGYFGYGRPQRIYNGVAMEAFKAYPNSLLFFYDNALFIMGLKKFNKLTDKWDYAYLRSLAYGFLYSKENDFSFLPEALKNELEPKLPADWLEYVAIPNGVFHLLALPILLVAFLVTPFALLSRLSRPFIIFLWLIYFYNVAVISITGTWSAPRYEDAFKLVLFIVIGIGADQLFKIIKVIRRSGDSNDLPARRHEE